MVHAGLHSFSRGIPKDTLSLGKGPSAYPTYPRIVISAGRAPRRYPYPPYRKPWPSRWCSLQCGHVQALVVVALPQRGGEAMVADVR